MTAGIDALTAGPGLPPTAGGTGPITGDEEVTGEGVGVGVVVDFPEPEHPKVKTIAKISDVAMNLIISVRLLKP